MRLAAIDCPDQGEVGYQEARSGKVWTG